jgi:DNA-binding protein H-NS
MTAPKQKPEAQTVAKVDLSKLSFADLQELAKEAGELADMKRGEEIKVLADGYAKKAAAAGFTPKEAIDALIPYLPAAKTRAPRGSKGSAAPKVYKDADSTGARPEVGKSYLLNGTTWLKASKIGATKKEFVAAVTTGGKKWSELLVK